MDRYAVLGTLNHGSYGTVQLVRELRTSRMRAAKRVSLALSSAQEVEDEIAVQARAAGCPRVVQLVDHFQSDNEYVLILEYCSGGDLHDRIARGAQLSASEIKRMMLQLLDALEYCHAAGVYHRDVKPENIFLQHNGSIKLGDWGLATTKRWCADFGTGSELYMAPECFDRQEEEYDAAGADVWAAGIVMLNMLFGRTPFKEATERDLLFKDFATSRESLFDIFPTLTRDVFAVLRHSLTLNPEHRSIPKMREALNSIRHWSTDDEIAEVLAKQPLSAQAASPTSAEAGIEAGIEPGAVPESGRTSDEDALAEDSLVGERSPARGVPVVHKPFRVPTAVARSLHTPTHAWDRRKMFTPPSSSSPLHTRSKLGSYRLSLPRHLEQPEEEVEGEDEVANEESLSSPSSTSSTLSEFGKDDMESMFPMDDGLEV